MFTELYAYLENKLIPFIMERDGLVKEPPFDINVRTGVNDNTVIVVTYMNDYTKPPFYFSWGPGQTYVCEIPPDQ